MNSRKIYTTVNSGKLKGKKIYLPSKTTTRSTKSIIKESYFNTIQFEIIDKNFIEVFAGSGSMGIEAVSRGAKKVYFIEKEKDAYETLLNNLKNLDIENFEAFYDDSFVKFPSIVNEIEEKSYFYFDPPFDIRDGMKDIYEKTFSMIETIPADICELITIEHISRLKIPDIIGDFKHKKSKKFGKTTLSYYI